MCGTRQIAFFSTFLLSNKVLNCHKMTHSSTTVFPIKYSSLHVADILKQNRYGAHRWINTGAGEGNMLSEKNCKYNLENGCFWLQKKQKNNNPSFSAGRLDLLGRSTCRDIAEISILFLLNFSKICSLLFGSFHYRLRMILFGNVPESLDVRGKLRFGKHIEGPIELIKNIRVMSLIISYLSA